MKKHILFIVENRAVPHDTRVWLEAKSARDWGNRVTVISPKEKFAESSHEVIEGIHVYRHGLPQGKGSATYLLEYCAALFWQLFLALRIYFHKPFHVIHSANPPDITFLVALVFRPLGVRFIFDVHDLTPDLFQAKFPAKGRFLFRALILLEKLSAKTASLIITTNESYREIIRARHHIPEERFEIVRNDPDLARFPKNHKPQYDSGGKTKILYLGTISRQDGADNLLFVLNHLVHKYGRKDFICHIVGDGEALSDLKALAIKLEVTDYVDFTGYLFDRKAILDHLYSADICVEPAPLTVINNHSTFIKVLEFMAASKPIVAFDLKETHSSAGDAAVYVPAGKNDLMAQAIVDLMDDSKKREELGRRGRLRIESEYNWNRSVAEMAKGYRKIGLISEDGR